jgi:alkanesulfonate monooxygenase SsuD/methylene tetrahydromethanopterin reductase-like flavin-dependent oxidoreductase (luciferase family)
MAMRLGMLLRYHGDHLPARTMRIKAGVGIMQTQARTPACTAMTALTLQALSNNRFLLGRRGLARRAVRQADGAHPRIH